MDETRGQEPAEDRTDPGADTARFRAFVEREPEPVARPDTRFRTVSLLIGLAAFAVIVWLLLSG